MRGMVTTAVCAGVLLWCVCAGAADPPPIEDEGVFSRAYAPGEPMGATGEPTTGATTSTSSMEAPADADLMQRLELIEKLLDVDLRPRITGIYYTDEDTDQMGEDLGWYELRLDFAVPLHRGETTSVGGYVKAGYIDFNNHNLIIPMTGGAKFPSELYDVELGVFFFKQLSNDRMLGGRVAVGSPSDEPFDSWDELTFRADVFYSIPWRTNLRWIFLLSYANDREWNFPVPGVELLWQPSDQLTLIVGFPALAATWKPTSQWELTAIYLMPHTVNLKAAYQFCDSASVYGAFDWDNRSFWRHDRADDDDRLRYYEKRLTLGVRWNPTQTVFVDVGGGYAFDRFWFEDEDYDDRGDTKIDIDDGFFGFLKVGIDLGVAPR